MPEAPATSAAVADFLRRWEASCAAERAALTDAAGPVIAETLARAFLRTRTDKVAELLATLAAFGQAREAEFGTYCG